MSDEPNEQPTCSFAKRLVMGEIEEEMVFPFPRPSDAEREQIRNLKNSLHEVCDDRYDPRAVEEAGWVGDDILRDLGERGLLGLAVPEKYGGQGLGASAYCLVFEEIGRLDPTLSIVLGVHQSIGLKGIELFGTEEQKERFLPDLASGRKLAGFALTEPTSGSDAYHLQTRATRQPDGSFRLNGEKRYIGNGGKDVVTTFARTDNGDHVALILEKGMEGFEVGKRYQTMGLRGNDLRHLHFNNVRVPKENLLGEVGDGFRIAMDVLNDSRISLGTGAIGVTTKLVDMTLDHIHSRRQFDRYLAEFELVEDKVSWMTSNLYGLQSMAYLTTGMIDAGVEDYAVEAAMAKVAGTEFLWYAANRAFQLAGGKAYMRDQPYERILRDIRVFPIFEGANDVLRCFIALSSLKPLGDELGVLKEMDIRSPVKSLGLLIDYVEKKVRREVMPDRITRAHHELQAMADPIADQVNRLRDVSEELLMTHGKEIHEHQKQLRRLAHALMDIYAQVATISRVTDVFERLGIGISGEEHYIAETFCQRADRRVHSYLDHIEENDDERMRAIAQATYKRGAYGHSI